MNFAELKAAVVVETNRADLVDQIQQAVLASTFKLHTCDYFFKDINPVLIQFDDPNLYIQMLDTAALTRYRAINYGRKYDPSMVQYEQNPNLLPPLSLPYLGYIDPRCLVAEIDITTPDDIFDIFGYEKTNVAYQAGSNIFIKSNTPLAYLLLGYYQFPKIDPADYISWIANDFPYAIVYDASFSILAASGNQDAATRFKSADGRKGLAIEQRDNLIASNVVVRGY